MDNFFRVLIDKVEDTLYEILGLLFPSLTLCVVLVEPVFYTQSFSLRSIPQNDCIEVLKFLNTFLNEFWSIVFIFFVFYVVGNVIKVAAKIYYKFGETLFDDTLFVIIASVFNFIKKKDKDKETKWNKFKEKPVVVLVMVLYSWIKKTLSFSTENYDKNFEGIYTNLAINELNIFDFEQEKIDKWFLFYKEATTIIKQKKIDTLCYKFLAKYNSFRSLEFVFAVGIIYNILILFSQMAINKCIYSIVLGVNIVCLVCFHEKFKRYWKLCGNEAIVGLDYIYRHEKGSKQSE